MISILETIALWPLLFSNMENQLKDKNSYREGCNLVEESLLDETPLGSIEKMRKGIGILEALQFNSPDSEEINYALGYAWYNYPGDKKERDDKLIEYFERVLSINPSHDFANLYLGHYFFDKARYREAQSCFKKVNAERSFPKQIWRKLKLDELLLCCHIRVDVESLTSDMCDEFISEYTKYDEDDRPVILELRAAIEYLKERSERSEIIDRLSEFSNNLEL